MLKSRFWLIAAMMAVGVFVQWRQAGVGSGASAVCPECLPSPAVGLRSDLAAGFPSPEAVAEPAIGFVLPPRQSELWERPVVVDAFARFKQWTAQWHAAGPAERSALLDEGIGLASRRRTALADLIVGDPQRALELAVPSGVRRELPPSVALFLEEPINARGNYAVVGSMPLPGHSDEIPAVARWAEVNGQRCEVFTFGEGLSFVTKANVPLNGFALPATAGTNPRDRSLVAAEKIMALSPSPVRQLEAGEVLNAIAASTETVLCPTSDQAVTANADPVGTEIGGESRLYCGASHAASAAGAEVDEQNLTLPDGVAAAGEPTTSASAYTQGYKRLLILRVDFPDYTGEQAAISQADAENLVRDLRSYLLLMSYGSHALAPVDVGGSGITPVLRMPNNAAYYDNAGLSKLYPDAKSRAQAAGFDLADYDWLGVFTRSRPAASYAGLAYVGGVGFHMAKGSFSKHVVSHELGHNLGLPHAHRWDTSDTSIIGAGSLVEYGNKYDPIGATYDSIPGEKHYVGSYKNYLDWIVDADAPLVTASGSYRITTTDDSHATGRRLLRVKKDTRDYWLEFRQNFTDATLANAIFLQWANTDGRENYLLDARPGESGTTVAIGRTFSDPAANGGVGVHVTPMGKGGTFPESMDMFISIGAPVGNQPPTFTLTSTTTAAPANSPVQFTATATDPNSDVLAYYWEFGDGTFSYDNKADQSHLFSAGEYVVQCTVSDMKGGTAKRSMVVQIDTPATFRIAGRVLDTQHRPLGGIKLIATSGSETKSGFSNSDGTYTLTNLGAKAWTVTARDAVSNAFNFSAPFTPMPVSVGPSAEGIDFIGSTGPQETVTPIIAKKAVWRYFSQGTDPATGWTSMAFNDSGWDEGNGLLGYGNGSGQTTTTIPYGGVSNDKWTGYYFRRAFNLAAPIAFPTLRLEVQRDDGVIVYLNGHEIFRDNMPAGPATFDSQAVDTTEPNDSLVTNIDIATLPPGLLVAGTNLLAAQVHQASSTSSDMAFDAALSGVAPLAGVGTSAVYVTAPVDGAVLEAPAAVLIEAAARVKNATVTKVEFFGDGAWLGEDVSEPFGWSWNGPPAGAHVVHVVATLSTDPTQTSAPTRFAIGPAPTALVASNATWKYLATGTAAPAGWVAVGFDDAGWPSGPAQLGFGDGDEQTIIPGGTSTNRHLSSYFRTAFTIEDPKAVTQLVARIIRDDGVAVYLNGTEIIRSNLPAGTLAYSTLATGAGANAIENAVYAFVVDPILLVPGRNVLAAEVHQNDATSADLSFACALEARTSLARPRGLTLTGPSQVVLPTAVVVSADVVAGGTLGVTRVDFLANGVVIGQDAVPPYALTWSHPPAGAQSLTAVATDSVGGTVTSNALEISVAEPYQAVALVSFGETWRYVDDGSVLPATWKNRTGYDDSGWSQGPAQLGYGGDGEATILSYGREPAARHITTWFRKHFTLANPAGFSALLLRLVRDDGAIVYLNGTEILRSNMGPGPPTAATLASAAVEGIDERTALEFVVSKAALVAGDNVLAVELHQAAANSGDLGLDVELLGLTPGTAAFFLTSPAASQTISAAVDLPLSVYADPSLGFSKVEFFAGPAKIGESSAGPGFGMAWTTPLKGSYPLYAKATPSLGGPLTTAPVVITIGDARTSALFLAAGSSWKYWDSGTLPAANWTAVAYDDTAWLSGPGRLGFGADGEATAVESGHSAYYFRKTFSVSATGGLSEVALRFQRDDGVVIYLNGAEIARDNMPAGAPTPSTLAAADINDEHGWLRRTLPPSVLQPGLNVLSAEVHQRTATSGDLGWDAELTALGLDPSAIANTPPSVPPILSLDRPGSADDPLAPFHLRFPETTGRLYLIESSDNLSLWQPLSYEFARSGQIDLPVPPASRGFYRVRWLLTLP